jgi:hypothetical protein
MTVAPAKIENRVLRFDITCFFQSLPEGSNKIRRFTGRPATNPADHRRSWLLRARRERPRRRRAAEHRYELASPQGGSLSSRMAPYHIVVGMRVVHRSEIFALMSVQGHKPRRRSGPGMSMSAVPPIASKVCAPQRKTPSARRRHAPSRTYKTGVVYSHSVLDCTRSIA